MTLLLPLSGCGDLLSVHPLATPATITFEPSLIGQWTCTNKDWKGTAVIRVAPDAKDSYDVVWIPGEPDGEPWRLSGQLVKVGGRVVFDLVAIKRTELSIPGHFFMLMEKTAGGVTFHWLDSEWLRAKLNSSNAPPHAKIGDKPVLTADSARLNAFLAEYGLDPKAKSASLTFNRASKN